MMRVAQIWVALLMLVVACRARDGGSSSRERADDQCHSVSTVDPVVFLSLESKMTCLELIETLGNPRADHGSGVYIMEFGLEPHGYALVHCCSAIGAVEVVWSSSTGSPLPSCWDESGIDARRFSLGCVDSDGRSPVDPERFTEIPVGMTRSDAISTVGLLPTEDNGRILAWPLLPKGCAEVNLDDRNRVDRVDIVWRREYEREAELACDCTSGLQVGK